MYLSAYLYIYINTCLTIKMSTRSFNYPPISQSISPSEYFFVRVFSTRVLLRKSASPSVSCSCRVLLRPNTSLSVYSLPEYFFAKVLLRLCIALAEYFFAQILLRLCILYPSTSPQKCFSVCVLLLSSISLPKYFVRILSTRVLLREYFFAKTAVWSSNLGTSGVIHLTDIIGIYRVLSWVLLFPKSNAIYILCYTRYFFHVISFLI